VKLGSRSTQEAFARFPWLRIGSLVGASLLLIASLFGVWQAFSLPSSTEQPITVASYEHRGQFNYLVYLKPNSLYGSGQPQEQETEQETSHVFFRNIIDSAELAFSYRFESSEPVSSIANGVVITAVAGNPGVWQKEITVLEETHEGDELRVDFPLLPLLDSVQEVVDDIKEEIGVGTSQNQFTIRATVNTTAQTAAGTIIEDDFSHEITVVVQTYTLTLDGSLKGSDTGAKDDISYNEEGWFDYEVHLKPNKLYETDVLRSETPAATDSSSSAQTLGPGLTYFTNIVDSIEASFSYQFASDKSATNLVEEVEVTALLEYPSMWTKSFTLVPKTSKSGPFLVNFPVNFDTFSAAADTLRTELGFGSATYDLTLQATVHTTADIGSEHIDQAFTQSLKGQLGMTTFALKGDLGKQQPGTIVESATVPVAKTWVFRGLSLAGLALAVLAFVFVLRNSRQAQAVAISGIEEEALRAKRKHKGVIVDVSELPAAGAKEVVIPIGSVDELVRAADALLKPVLHHSEAGKHTYCVIDAGTRYLYVSQTQE
jgi:hypothetical protein